LPGQKITAVSGHCAAKHRKCATKHTAKFDLWIFADAKFNIPPLWREWLGNLRAAEVENCNLLLITKSRSSSHENQNFSNASRIFMLDSC
jgi:hypothetical protein